MNASSFKLAGPSPMHRLLAAAVCLVLLPAAPVRAQPAPALAPAAPAPAAHAAGDSAGDLAIAWEVRNRFRLFREERDFTLHLDAMRDGGILAAEERLAVQSDGRGWARNTVRRLCIDANGHVAEPCTRDGVKESYLTPADHAVTVHLAGAVPVGAVCAWSFDDGEAPRQTTLDCAEPINFRARYGRATHVGVEVTSAEARQQLRADIRVRDIFIAGLGDSVASGEGNPDRPVDLGAQGFCFRSYLGGASSQYFRPVRAGFRGARACEGGDASSTLANWQKLGAQWLNTACHRSLYSYQTRAALALALRFPHIAVTFLPLACTGASIPDGLLGPQRARECAVAGTATSCTGRVNGQLAELSAALGAARRRQPERQLDLVFLSIGANDIDFSGLVADVIVDATTERELLSRAGLLGSVDDARAALRGALPQQFGRLRQALKPLVGGNLARVVYVSYANPTLADGAACPGGRGGFDIHPAFNADGARLKRVADFVQSAFLPRLKDLALCQGGVICNDPGRDRMSFADRHQAAFAGHGFCARAASDPEFDRQCFSESGKSFDDDLVTAAAQPLVCGRKASEFRAYAPRARWIRDANDSYFAAMTYPQGMPSSMQPSDIHDATWGILSAVYGGAIHPSAQGHAAMADAALPAAEAVLGLSAADLSSIDSAPLPPPTAGQTRE
jgi:lysophospholipase L1-like esterase